MKYRKEDVFISVVIPVYNAEETLVELYDRISKTLIHIKHEIIFVDDHSSDNSWNIISELSRQHNNNVCARHVKNFGQDNAIFDGLKLAKGNYVVIMDDDLQHAPEDILVLLEKCSSDTAVCYGSFKVRKHESWKIQGSYLNDLLARIIYKKPNDLYLSPFKIVTRKTIDKIISHKGYFVYIDALILKARVKIDQVFLLHYVSRKSHSSYTLLRSFFVFINHMLCQANLFHNFMLILMVMAFYVNIFIAYKIIFSRQFSISEISMPLFLILLISAVAIIATHLLIRLLFRNFKIFYFKRFSNPIDIIIDNR